jgi:hypothetical protein
MVDRPGISRRSRGLNGVSETDEKEEEMTKPSRFPAGWNEQRVRALLKHYEGQTEEEAVAEDEAAFRRRDPTVMVVPKRLVPAITKLITREEAVAPPKRPNKAQPTTRKTRRG